MYILLSQGYECQIQARMVVNVQGLSPIVVKGNSCLWHLKKIVVDYFLTQMTLVGDKWKSKIYVAEPSLTYLIGFVEAQVLLEGIEC